MDILTKRNFFLFSFHTLRHDIQKWESRYILKHEKQNEHENGILSDLFIYVCRLTLCKIPKFHLFSWLRKLCGIAQFPHPAPTTRVDQIQGYSGTNPYIKSTWNFNLLFDINCSLFIVIKLPIKLWYFLRKRVSMWQLETQLFASSYIWLTYIFTASYSMLVTSVCKKSSTDQSELEK